MESGKEIKQYPFFIRATVILFGLILLFFILSILQAILVPLAIAMLLAILLNPLNTRLERRLPKILAILASITIAFGIFAGILFFLSSQIAMLSDMLPTLEAKFILMLGDLQQWVRLNLGLSMQKQVEIINETANNSKGLVGQTLGTILTAISVLVLIPLYIFLFLFYKPLLLEFAFHVFKEEHSLRVAEILSEAKAAIQSFIIGLLIETAIVAAMNSIALLILGVPYAILIGVIGGLLNIIPYLGGLVAILLPVLLVTITKDGYTTQAAIIGAYLVIQFIDNNILVPRIVSAKVRINALVSILVVLLGGALWGVAGMFLSIPIIAVVKIIFDRIEGLKAWGKLLGDEVPEEHAGVAFQKRWNRIVQRLGKKKRENPPEQ
jgi:predicted PurR-regulated permease PerM